MTIYILVQGSSDQSEDTYTVFTESARAYMTYEKVCKLTLENRFVEMRHLYRPLKNLVKATEFLREMDNKTYKVKLYVVELN